MDKHWINLNPKQLLFLMSKPKDKTIVAGRGFGKTFLMGIQIGVMQNDMPRAKVLIAGLTFNQIFNITLPVLRDAWERMCLYEYDPKTKFGHYTVGVQPPSHFYRPYQKLTKYEYVITFANGFTLVLGSIDRPDTLRGGNYDACFIDESALIEETIITRVLRKMVRGNTDRPFSDHYLHHGFFSFTSMPWTLAGQHVFKAEQLALENPKEYYYMEGKTRDNLRILGKDFLKKQKQTSSELEYLVECENYRLDKVPNTFYPSFSESTHCVSNTYSYIENMSNTIDTDATGLEKHKLLQRAKLTVIDVFYNKSKKLLLSFDFNAAITSMIIAQHDEESNELRILDELYVTYQTITDLITLFLNKYGSHDKKYVEIYGDRNGNNQSALAEYTFYSKIIEKLTEGGWKCEKKVIGLDPRHKEKHRVIDNILREENPRAPKVRINKNNCKWLIVSIQNSGITMDFGKDKSDEKNISIDQRSAPHLSDCFDSLVYRYSAPLLGLQVYAPSGIASIT
jgi:hypothetical protein